MSTLNEMIEVMKAHAAGQPIESRARASNESFWENTGPVWNWDAFEYRVKQEPPKPTSERMFTRDEMMQFTMSVSVLGNRQAFEDALDKWLDSVRKTK